MIAVFGAFDGFHRGHMLLFERAKELALPQNQEWGAITFEPHPGLYTGSIKGTLFTLNERKLIQRFLKVPRIISLKFNEELAHLSPLLFWNFLRERIEVEGVLVGTDFRFGYRRTGDVTLLERFCREGNIPFLSMDLLEHLGTKISSSLIRAHVEAGDCGSAIKNLGYPYFIWARVAHGLERGRTLGFPTANLDVPHTKLFPSAGVYAVAVFVDGQWKAGALSIGENPTFEDVLGLRAEVFILDYEGNLYDKNLLVFFLYRLRSQVRFDNVEQLTLQIGADVERARSVFKHSFDSYPHWYTGFQAGLSEIE